MLFAKGTKVKFLHSKDEGFVMEQLNDGMVNVRLSGSDMVIPVFEEDLIRADEPVATPKPSGSKPAATPKKDIREEKKADLPEMQVQYAILKSQGIQLAAAPVFDAEGAASRYRLFLLNDTRSDAVFNATLSIKGRTPSNFNGKLNAHSTFAIGELRFEQLNDSPELNVNCWRLTTEGSGPVKTKTLKLKPKHFFKRPETAPLLNIPAYLFVLIPDLAAGQENKEEPGENLRTYTRKMARPQSTWLEDNVRSGHEVMEKATFVPEIDLHIENLRPNAKKMNASEIFRIQIQHFDAYLDKAIRLGVDRVFIIHGLGEGRLKDAIASRLLQTPEVVTFKNEFHPRYGFGATEVIFVE
ncbi:MAG TPA: Smr/MutS family protein [Flavilitoribacter sp.]|nr:Smr/MutS family protein [Flavilitoribacter sp.]